MRSIFALILCLGLAACAVAPAPRPVPEAPTPRPAASEKPLRPVTQQELDGKLRQFLAAQRRMEPVIEAACRAAPIRQKCDFQIVVDERPELPGNAFQTVDANGRPILGFTLALIAEARNEDEVAFVLGHEAGHHIAGHLARQQLNAARGAAVFSKIVGRAGASPETLARAQQLGAAVGARSYSKAYELEADEIGTKLTIAAGYDPIKGADFFFRVPDPGDVFLGTHPPNAARVSAVRRAAGLS